MKKSIFSGMLVLLLSCTGVRDASAAFISLGERIALTPTTFALPVQINDAIELSEWSFDLTYDPADLQINTACDPFGGDLFCSLTTGAVTEGEFFAAGAPFNLLIPGFIALDPVTIAQTGSLFGVNGLYGGALPSPSGAGVLAYIQFLQLGDGDGGIDVDDGIDEPDPVTSVPEPGTAALSRRGPVAVAPCRRRVMSRRLRANEQKVWEKGSWKRRIRFVQRCLHPATHFGGDCNRQSRLPAGAGQVECR